MDFVKIREWAKKHYNGSFLQFDEVLFSIKKDSEDYVFAKGYVVYPEGKINNIKTIAHFELLCIEESLEVELKLFHSVPSKVSVWVKLS